MRAPRKIAFVLAASDHGTMIVNRFDYRMVSATTGYGVGFQILESASFDAPEVATALRLLDLRRQHYGDGVVAVDCGANIGVHTVEWARHMSQWGSVLGIEVQGSIFYALAGNVALNNCFNAGVIRAAVGSRCGTMRIPTLDYTSPGSFGSLELRQTERTEFIGQKIDYRLTVDVPAITIDSLALPRVDLIKIDIEGMELEALEGGSETILKHRPIMLIEQIKVDREQLATLLTGWGYRTFLMGLNVLAVHADDPCLGAITAAA